MSYIPGYSSQYSNSTGKQVYTTETGTEYWYSDGKTGMDIQDFFSLIAAQLANQDPMNPSDQTEFMSQLASFSALQMQESILYATNASFVSSLVGKTVVCAKLDSSGNVVSTTGVVERVIYSSGNYEFVVDGKTFTLENLMEVKQTVLEETENNEEVEALKDVVSALENVVSALENINAPDPDPVEEEPEA